MRGHHYNFNPGENRFGPPNPANRIFFGIAVAVVGVGFLLKALGLLPPFMNFSWPVILIVLGAFIGMKNGFTNNAWWILMLIGVAHLIPQFHVMGQPSRHLVWPIALVIFGLMIAFRPRRKACHPRSVINSHVSPEGRLFVDVAFGGRKEIITAKDFKGGVISVSFGGSEINLSQADFTEESIVLDCRVSFGAVELIIPSNWEIENNIRPSMGSVDDERMIYTGQPNDGKKKLILQGSVSFGSIEIKSF